MKKVYFSFLIFSLFFGLQIANAQVGSSCGDPVFITSLPFSQTGLNTSATADNYDASPCSGSSTYMTGNDFVFTYTPVSNEIVTISLANVSSFLGSGIFVTDSCPDNINASCIAEASGLTAPTISNLNLIAGQQYYIIVSSRVISILGQTQGQTTGFDISIQSCGSTPVADFSYVQNGLNVSFTNASTNGNTYQWLFGDEMIHNWFFAANDTNPVHTFAGYGTYTVEMVATNNCGSTDTITTQVTLICPGPAPLASFSYTTNNTTATFANTSVNAASSSWLFGDEAAFPVPTGDPTTNPVHTYAQAGSYTVQLTVTTDSGCQSVFIDTIVVSCNLTTTPIANFTYVATDSTVTFTNQSSDATNYTWLYGDEPIFPPATGDTTSNPVHTYNGWGTYTVQLTASNCFASSSISVSIFLCNTTTLPIANFTYVPNGMDVSFTNTSTDGNTYQWLFGDEAIHNWFLAANDTNPVHTYAAYGTYTVEMVATNLCGITDTLTYSLTLSCPGPIPSASFTYDINNTTVQFTNTSVNAVSYNWLFGDEAIFPIPTGDTTENPVHIYAQTGSYPVQLTVTSVAGCQSVINDTIVVYCLTSITPVASFTYSITDTIVTFVNTSTNGSTYQWLFGDEVIGNWIFATSGENQIHTYNGMGTYTVQMIASNCFSSDTISVTIVLCQMTVASFTHSISGLSINLQSTATNATSQQWFFGDETTSLPSDTTANPTHTYAQPGTYQIIYITTNDCGSDTAKTNITIVGIEQIVNNIQVSCFPNPVKEMLNISVNDLAGEPISLSIQNILGSEIYNDAFTSASSNYSKQINTKDFAKGVYFVKINCERGSKVIKIVSE